jgi:predicted RecB family nuclease
LQCHRRLWWETHERDAPELVPSAELLATFDRGSRVGELACTYVPGGTLIDVPYTEPTRRVEETRKALAGGAKVIYEAAFLEDGVFVAVDILSKHRGKWTVTEVKSTTKVKPEHIPDAAVQTHVVRAAGLAVDRVELMHLDRECRFPDLSNLFRRADVTDEVEELLPTVLPEAKRQLKMLAGRLPDIEPGDHCHTPYECAFSGRCWDEPEEHSVSTLYRIGNKADALVEQGYDTIHDLPSDTVLSHIADRQRRAVQEGRVIVEPGLASALAALRGPIAYLDFETVMLAIPVWDGCRPYDQVAVQLSCHLETTGGLHHVEWLVDGSHDPREAIARALIDAVRGAKTILTYSVAFERGRVEELRAAVPKLAGELDDVISRLADLLPIVRQNVYHPDFGGSFSLKSVLPALVPSMSHAGLEIADGGTASNELRRLMFDEKMPERERAELRKALLEYCRTDTLAMVELLKVLRRLAEPATERRRSR